MPRPRYNLSDIILNVADIITHTDTDDSPTTIRTLINDSMDALDKSGYTVNFQYDQELAVKRVKARVKENLKQIKRMEHV